MSDYITIYLIRHARQSSSLCNVNVELSKEGIMQSELLAERLQKCNIKKVYSSDLIRAVETADIIRKYNNLENDIDDTAFQYADLEETDFGELTGLEDETSMYKAQLIVPGFFRKDLMVVFFIGNKTDGSFFNKEDLEFLRVLGPVEGDGGKGDQRVTGLVAAVHAVLEDDAVPVLLHFHRGDHRGPVGLGQQDGDDILPLPVDVGGHAAHEGCGAEVLVEVSLIVDDEALQAGTVDVVAHVVVVEHLVGHGFGALLGLAQVLRCGALAAQHHQSPQGKNQG